jgi:hypothetical protein
MLDNRVNNNCKQKEKLLEMKPIVNNQCKQIVNLPDINKIPLYDTNTGFQKQEELDKLIDEKLDMVLNGIQELGVYAETMAQKITTSNELIDEITIDIESQNEALIQTNKQLVNIVKKIRHPKKLCMDITLLLLLLGLIGLIIKLVVY